MTLRRAIVTVATVVLLSSGIGLSAAASQTTGSLELVAQSSWVDDGGIYDLQVRVAGADPESSVLVRVLPAWAERDDFLRQDLPAEIEPLLELEPTVLGDIQNTSNEVLGFQILVAGPNTEADDDLDEASPIDVLRTDGGSAVYPVEVTLFDADGNQSDQLVTSLIELPRGERAAPLQVAIALESQVLPSTMPDGSIDIDPEDLLTLEVLTDAIVQHSSASVAIALSPETLAALEAHNSDEATQILENFRENVEPDQLLASPFTKVQEQAWIDAGLTPELRELYLIGSGVVNTTLGVAPDTSVMLLDRTVDADGLAVLTDPDTRGFDPFGVAAVIVRPAQLESLDRSVFPQALTTRFVIPTSEGTTIPALVADGGLANHFTNPGGATYNANRLLADLTLLSLQNSDVRQAVVVNPPDDWVPDATFLNVMLTGLERIPAIRGVSPVEALAETAFTPERGLDTLSPPLRRELQPQRDADNIRSFRTEFSQAQTAIDSWAEVIPGDEALNNRLEQLLRLSTDYRLSDGERMAYIDTIYTLIDAQKESSITTPESETITLTGRMAEVPITIENNLGVDASVLIILDSEKLTFPDGQSLALTLPPGPNRIEVPIEARASGDSPIRVQVFTPDRSVLLGSSEVLVRTFAFSGVGIVIGGISLAVLLVWWLRHRRKSRATVPPDSSALGSDPEDALVVTEHIGV